MHNPFMLLVLLAAAVLLFMATLSNKRVREQKAAKVPTASSVFVLCLFMLSGVGCGLAVAHDLGLLS